MLQQIVTNLLANAIELTDEGSVDLRLFCDLDDRPRAIEVEDTGIVIPEGELPRLAERFHQVERGSDRRFEGSGLGLAICRPLCERLGYQLAVESAAGSGTLGFASSSTRALWIHCAAMSANRDLAAIFDQMAAGLELLGANPFRANAHARAARSLRDQALDVGEIVRRDPTTALSRLAELPDIGKGMAAKIVDYVLYGRVKEHQEMLERVPVGLFELLAIPGLGPKAVQLLWTQLGITSLDELEARLDSPELLALPRMGERTVANIKKAIAFAQRSQDRVPLGIARPLALELERHLAEIPGTRRVAHAGSVRRGCETIGDLDLVIACDDADAVRDAFVGHPLVSQVLARGETKCSVRLERGGTALQADLRIVDEGAWGAAMLYFTGSKEHNVRLRQIAIAGEMRLNEYGVFAGTDERPQDRGAIPLAAASEAEIYRQLGLPLIPAELREDRDEWQQPLPQLIKLEDIRCELHSHTRASDGKLTIDELAAVAKARGFHTLAITDHSASSVIANGLDTDRLRRHIDAVREADQRIEGIDLLAGSEVDILPDGRLDYDDEVLALLDVVVASPHAALRQDRATATERLLRAIRHPLVHVLGHPSGRIIGRREGLELDVEALVDAAAVHRVALEINANWRRLDLRDSHARAALAAGCLLAIDTDAHSESDFDQLVYGVLTARRAGLTAERCLNTWPAERLRRWLAAKR